jgi:hypothetical protein
MLKLRSIGINDYRVLEAGQRIGRIRLADERTAGLAVGRHDSPARRPPHGLIPRLQHGQG